MAQVAKDVRVGLSSEIFRDDRNPQYPVLKGTMTILHRYVVGRDYQSGDNLALTLVGAKEILFAVAKTPSNTLVALTEGGQAPKLTLTTGNLTTDVQLFIVYRV